MLNDGSLDTEPGPLTACLICGEEFPFSQMRSHSQACSRYYFKSKNLLFFFICSSHGWNLSLYPSCRAEEQKYWPKFIFTDQNCILHYLSKIYHLNNAIKLVLHICNRNCVDNCVTITLKLTHSMCNNF